MRKNDLLSIEGVGEKTLEMLLNKFGTLNKISRLSYDELTTMIKPSIAKRVFEYFNEWLELFIYIYLYTPIKKFNRALSSIPKSEIYN